MVADSSKRIPLQGHWQAGALNKRGDDVLPHGLSEIVAFAPSRECALKSAAQERHITEGDALPVLLMLRTRRLTGCRSNLN
jgi:hypothetical protein